MNHIPITNLPIMFSEYDADFLIRNGSIVTVNGDEELMFYPFTVKRLGGRIFEIRPNFFYTKDQLRSAYLAGHRNTDCNRGDTLHSLGETFEEYFKKQNP